jgi:hypothetical protein
MGSHRFHMAASNTWLSMRNGCCSNVARILQIAASRPSDLNTFLCRSERRRVTTSNATDEPPASPSEPDGDGIDALVDEGVFVLLDLQADGRF